MKGILLITIMLLSAAGFGTEIEKPVQIPTNKLQQDASVKVEPEAVKAIPKQPQPDSGLLPKHDEPLIAELQQIVMLLNRKLPGWNRGNKLNDKREKIIEAFVTSLGLSLQYSAEKPQSPQINSKFKPLPLLWLQHDRIAYLRIDSFTPEVLLQFRQVHDILVTNYRLSGMIIDLRNCRSFDYKNAIKCLKQLTDAYQAKPPTKVRIALLIGQRTLGAAEYFIHSLQPAVKPIIIGMQSGGQPFEYQVEKLTDGGYLLLPSVPETVGDKAIFTGQKPTIKIINNAQSDYKLQKKKPDVTVKYASNLLIALKATGGNPTGF
jgi:hypothetical protein